MDKMPWSRFHWMVIFGLGTAWILDGLEIQIVASAGYAKDLHMSDAQVGATATVYLVGQVVGALVFGRLTDKLGRKKLFIVTLLVYLIGSGLAGFSPNMWFLWVFRFIAGTGIGGEYSAINSAIDELMPGKYRGRVDLAINGTYWAGAVLGSLGSFYLLDTSRFAENIGWRIAFFIGPVLGLIIIFIRRTIPESPRWLMTHGRNDEAESTVDEIEERVKAEGVELKPVDDSKAIEVTQTPRLGFIELTKIFFGTYPKRSIYGFTMMVTQAFLYNAIFFSYALVLKVFYHVGPSSIPYYFFPFAIGNLLGPLVLGHLFDVVGRRKMIFATYGGSGVMLLIAAWLFREGALSAVTQTVVWSVIFFFASAGASAAYLTVSEIFPLELRGQAISYFFALAQGAGGVVAPWLFGHLIGGANNTKAGTGPLSIGYAIGAAIMIIGGLVAWFIGVDSEQKSLEDIAQPLSVKKRPEGGVTAAAEEAR
jgi:MFS family permease